MQAQSEYKFIWVDYKFIWVDYDSNVIESWSKYLNSSILENRPILNKIKMYWTVIFRINIATVHIA